MTGPITFEALAYVLVTLLGMGTIVGWGFKLLAARDRKIEKLETSFLMLKDKLADHELNAAKTYATKAGLSASLGDMKSSIDQLSERLNSMLDAMAIGNANRLKKEQ